MSERGQIQQPHDALQQLQYEFAQQGDYIKQLLAERDALAAQVEVLRNQLQIAHDVITCTDETGYVQDVGFLDIEGVTLKLKEVIESTSQQHLAEIRAQAAENAIQAVLNLPTFTAKNGSWLIKSIAWDKILPFKKEYAAKVRQGGE